ncbi:hypothetical protein [Lacticaseibacillus sp. GG6-2]
MLTWPLTTPEPAPLTISPAAPLPASYWQAVARGRWPKRYWLPTKEPTSDGLDGVAIHAFATPGPQTRIAGLPETLRPIAVDGQQIFAVAANGNIRYVDLEVDQWLTVALTWEAFVAQLQWRPPVLAAPYSAQQLAHALLVADNDSLPALFDILREAADWEAYTQWLVYHRQQPATQQEITFALTYLPLRVTQQQALKQLHQKNTR